MPAVAILHEEDPREIIFKNAGNLDDIEVFNSDVLVGVYERPKKMQLGGKDFYMPDQSREEDRYQGKTGVILKMGPKAFKDPNGIWFEDDKFSVGDWIVYRPSDAWANTLFSTDPKTGERREQLCRLMDDTAVRMRVPGPDRVY